MKNKNMVMGGLAAVIIIILALIIFLVTKGNDKDKKDKKKDNKEITEKYDIKDQAYDNYTISNISVNPLEDQTVVSFTIKNNKEEARAEGMTVFVIESGNVPTEEVSVYLSAIDAKDVADVEIIINGVYKKIDKISIKE